MARSNSLNLYLMLSLDQHCQLVPCSLRPLTTCSALEFIRRWLVMLRSSDHSTRFSKHETPAGTYRKLLSKCSSLAVMLGLLNASTSFGARVAGISPDSCENASFAAGECATSNELSATRHPLPPECKNLSLVREVVALARLARKVPCASKTKEQLPERCPLQRSPRPCSHLCI